MDLITLDVETFWSQTHTLSKMNPFDYVMHPETELISMALQLNDGEPVCVFGEGNIQALVRRIDWRNAYVIGHNMSAFDALILAWRLGVRPRLWGCTAAMARPIHAKTTGVSLGALVEHYGIGVKDRTALVNTQGKKLREFTDAERRAMAEYNKADVRQCFELFKRLRPHFTNKELWHIDAKIRALVEPQLELDVPMLEAALAEERARKRAALLELADMLDTRGIIPVGDTPLDEDYLIDRVRATLASAQKFSEVLYHQGVPVPMKPSPTNPANKVPALAKTDEAFQALVNHDDPLVAAAAQARLAVKSTLAETRMQAFIDAAKYAGGKWPVTTHYCGADTTGRACVPGDTKITVQDRGCVREIFIAELEDHHLVWDGEEFVSHEGLVDQGEREVMTYDGITATPDHVVYTEEGGEVPISVARERGYTLVVAREPGDSYPRDSHEPGAGK